jgi:hypothetical protein
MKGEIGYSHELNSSLDEFYPNFTFQDTVNWNCLPSDLDCSTPFCSSVTSLNGADQHLNGLFGPPSTVSTTDYMHSNLSWTHENSICQTGRSVIPALVEPSGDILETYTPGNQFGQALQENALDQSQRNDLKLPQRMNKYP